MLIECKNPYRELLNDRKSTCSLTWDPKFKSFFLRLLSSPALPKRVSLKAIRGCEPYESSYEISTQTIDQSDRSELLSWGKQLLRFDPEARLCILSNMLPRGWSKQNTRRLFALIRRSITDSLAQDQLCLYSPVVRARRDSGFPLHADCFMTPRLLLVFDEIPSDGTGASLFLTKSKLMARLRHDSERAAAREKSIRDLLASSPSQDSFDRLFAALYPTDEIVPALEQQFRVRFRSGDGYVIDDRHWLHGREACSGSVSSFRFHRLTF